jgi:hypothetical protein
MGPIERRIAREAKAMTKEQVFVKALDTDQRQVIAIWSTTGLSAG